MCAAAQVGVGAVVVNESGELLMVQERNGPLKGRGVWKMPTGEVLPFVPIVTSSLVNIHSEI